MQHVREHAKPLRFSEFAAHEGPLEGQKIRIDDVLNVELFIVAYR